MTSLYSSLNQEVAVLCYGLQDDRQLETKESL